MPAKQSLVLNWMVIKKETYMIPLSIPLSGYISLGAPDKTEQHNHDLRQAQNCFITEGLQMT